jgi:putative membrane protein
MRIPQLLLGLAFIASPALAQIPTAKNNAAIKQVHTVNDGGARRGANSFTQAQAREHILKSGFSDVSALSKDKSGVWRGTARKGGRTVHVGLDFKGNVSTGR